ncbi:unnamed protein product [Dicrocoelium dendriticum]|nr:unnamed protein product [Dicrocoelium dendriticum]
MRFTTRKKNTEDQNLSLKKEIGLLQGVGIVIGIIIGSGIFVSPVGVLAQSRSVGLSLVMWFVTGVVSALGAIVYAELGVTIPKSGGEYTYIFETFGPFPAFIAMWSTFVVVGTVGCAVNSLAFAQYILRPLYFTCDIPESTLHMVAILALLTLCFINCYRVTWATRLSVVFTVCKVSALLLIIGFGCYYLARGSTRSFENPFEDSATSPAALASAFYQGFWAFQGWNYLNFLTGEMKNPARTLPIVIVLSLSIVTSIYLLVNVAYLAVLSPFEVLSSGDGSAAVAVIFASRAMGFMAWIIPIFVGASVFGSINGEILSLSRICFTASERGHMPVILSMVSVTNLTPIPSVLAVVLISVFLQLFDDLFFLIELTGFAFTVVSTIAVCSLLHIRRTNPDLNQSSFRLPIWMPVLYLIINIGIGVFSIYDAPSKALISIGVIAISIPIYIVGVAWTNKPRAVRSFLCEFVKCTFIGCYRFFFSELCRQKPWYKLSQVLNASLSHQI